MPHVFLKLNINALIKLDLCVKLFLKFYFLYILNEFHLKSFFNSPHHSLSHTLCHTHFDYYIKSYTITFI